MKHTPENRSSLSPLIENWREYSILLLMLVGGVGVGTGAVVLAGSEAIIAGLTGGAMIGGGVAWSIRETIKE